jgi:hypothetical protein
MASVQAQPATEVLLLEHVGLRPELCPAMRIQLSGAAHVTCEPEQAELALPERIQAASERTKARGARIGVFLERDPDPRLVRMYIVGARSDQAVLAVEKIENRPDRDVDRSLALKVGASLEVVVRVERAAPAQVVQAGELPAVLAEPTSPAAAEPHLAPTWALFLDFGGGVATAARVHGVVEASLGAARVTRSMRLDLGLGFELGMPYEDTDDGARVRVNDRKVFLTARALRRLGRLEAGGELLLAGSFLEALGIARDGTQGEQLLFTPALGVGLDLRVRLFSSAYLRLSPRVEVPFIDRTLSVDDLTVVDFPPLQVTVPGSLIFYLPLTSGTN